MGNQCECNECEEYQTMTGISLNNPFKEKMYEHMLAEKNTIIFNDEIDTDIIEKVVLPIISINEDHDELSANTKIFDRKDNPIKIYINTDGGDAYSCLSAISVIVNSRTPVYTYNIGKAFSGGFSIFLAGHKRFALRFSTFGYHQVQGRPPMGSLQNSQEFVDESYRLQRMFSEFITSRTKIKQSTLDEINNNKRNWMISSEEAKRLGIVHEYYF